MDLVVTIAFGCTTAMDDAQNEYNIDGVINATPHVATVKAGGTIFTVKEGEKHTATKIGDYTVQLKRHMS